MGSTGPFTDVRGDDTDNDVWIDNNFPYYLNFVSNPQWGGLDRGRRNPKISFRSDGGYLHIRNRWTSEKVIFRLNWSLLREPEWRMMKEFLELKGDDSFWYVDPLTVVARANGTIYPSGYLVKVSSSDLSEVPVRHDGVNFYFSTSIVLEEI